MVAVLCDSCGGMEGSICILTVQDQSPAMPVKRACWAPGVAALAIFSIMACCAGDIWGGASAASAVAERNSVTAANTIVTLIETSLGLERVNLPYNMIWIMFVCL